MAKGQFLVASLILLISISLVGLLGVGSISADPQGNGASRIISVLGIGHVQGQAVIVDIFVEVQPGQNANEVAREALQSQGARPFESANLGSQGFTLIGSVWDTRDPSLVQHYNPGSQFTESEPNILAEEALTNTHATWEEDSDSFFEIDLGEEPTTRCPSLIGACKGPRVFDTFNDVGWLKLRPNILGVAVFSDSRQEADMALNTRFNWNVDCDNNVANTRDIETVFLHENGHVVGLGHSDNELSVMQPFYHGKDCDLSDDDREGAIFLYDDSPHTVSGTVTDTEGNFIEGATVLLRGTSLNAMTSDVGFYTISDVPDPVTYDITASKGDVSVTERHFVDEDTVVNLILDTGDGGNGGKSGLTFCEKNPFHKKCENS